MSANSTTPAVQRLADSLVLAPLRRVGNLNEVVAEIVIILLQAGTNQRVGPSRDVFNTSVFDASCDAVHSTPLKST